MLSRPLFMLLVVAGLVLTGYLSATICLNMIVKDESPVIERCLESVKPLIDYWVIVDTGSTDGTQEIIRKFMCDIPGELHERPWVDFGHNRNEALNLVKGKGDYILFIDADEKLLFSSDFSLPKLEHDFYYITTENGGTNYKRVQLVKEGLDWQWVGVVHEVVRSSQTKNYGTVEGVINFVHTDGNRGKDPLRFLKDAELLEKALKKDPTNTRDMFYLAQSYRDAGEFEKAAEAYRRRAFAGGWELEVFWSMLQIGLLQEEMKQDDAIVIDCYEKAYSYRPSRAEPLYRLANFYRRKGDYMHGYEVSKKGMLIKKGGDILFLEKWIYDYGLLLEFSICAYWVGQYTEAYLASLLILSQQALPEHIRECVERNLTWIDKKLRVCEAKPS